MLQVLDNKVIFMRHGFEKPEHLEATENLAETIEGLRKLEIKPYSVDVTVSENRQVIADFLKARGGVLDEKSIDKNSFILCNRYNDVWFQEFSLVQTFQAEIQYYYKYFEGPKILPNIDFILSAMSNENDLHLIAYVKDLADKNELKRFKKFRQMSQTNQNDVFHY